MRALKQQKFSKKMFNYASQLSAKTGRSLGSKYCLYVRSIIGQRAVHPRVSRTPRDTVNTVFMLIDNPHLFEAFEAGAVKDRIRSKIKLILVHSIFSMQISILSRRTIDAVTRQDRQLSDNSPWIKLIK
jgi:hypothetical protein